MKHELQRGEPRARMMDKARRGELLQPLRSRAPPRLADDRTRERPRRMDSAHPWTAFGPDESRPGRASSAAELRMSRTANSDARA
jgi:hypothetical protein